VTVEQSKLDRINALARKKKAEGLTPEETAEQRASARNTSSNFAPVCAAFSITPTWSTPTVPVLRLRNTTKKYNA
jgi:hypothetical protein